MPSKAEIFLNAKGLTTQESPNKSKLGSKGMWLGEERGVKFELSKANSPLPPIDALILYGEEHPACFLLKISGEEPRRRRLKRKFVSAFGKPLLLNDLAKDSRFKEVLIWEEKKALARQYKKTRHRISTILFKSVQ